MKFVVCGHLRRRRRKPSGKRKPTRSERRRSFGLAQLSSFLREPIGGGIEWGADRSNKFQSTEDWKQFSVLCFVLLGFGASEWRGGEVVFALVGGRWEAKGIGVTLFFAGEIFDDIAEGDHGVALIF